ncbi:single-stranded-DNA-specific exonuclease RecJ [Bdellovibrionota bacterium FG-2]
MGFRRKGLAGPRPWKQRAEYSSELIEQLCSETGFSPLTLRVCILRGLTSGEAIRSFLFPKLESLTSPMTIKDMDRAVGRLALARAQGECVRVFGDYDVDGTTAAALLAWVFRDFGISFEVRQPDRFKDGYGLNVGAVEDAAASGVKVLVTVDCGITSFEAAERAKALGVDLIVVDHHQPDPEKGIPPAFAVLDPHRPDCESGLKQLCGCGLAFYLALALRSHARDEKWFEPDKMPNLKQHLDLVVIATAADMVPLLGDNHILVRHGLEVLKNTKKPGVRALLHGAGISAENVSPGHLGFVLGPRINASGRMQNANLAFELLSTRDSGRATVLAAELEKLNTERAEVQDRIWKEVKEKVEAGLEVGKFQNAVVVADSRWHEGVVGIVATRVTETFHKPAAVVALREDGVGKGSVRSYGGKDILGALRLGAGHLLGFGGHRHAAGLTVHADKIEVFAQAFDDALASALAGAEVNEAEPLLTDGACGVSDLDLKTLEELERLGPFGPGNPEPVFSIDAVARNHRVLKERHLKMELFQGAPLLAPLEAIWFHAMDRRDLDLTSDLGSVSAWAGVPELNRFRGKVTPTLRVRDWRKQQT